MEIEGNALLMSHMLREKLGFGGVLPEIIRTGGAGEDRGRGPLVGAQSGWVEKVLGVLVKLTRYFVIPTNHVRSIIRFLQ